MKLAKRFDWEDTETIYRAVNEEDCDETEKGKVSFICFSEKGQKYRGVAYESTVADMTSFMLWKLYKIKGKRYNQVAEVQDKL